MNLYFMRILLKPVMIMTFFIIVLSVLDNMNGRHFKYLAHFE